MATNTKKLLKKVLSKRYTLGVAVIVLLLIALVVAGLNANQSSRIYTGGYEEAKLLTDKDRELVENFIRGNITKLTPETVTKGATWTLKELTFGVNQTGTFFYTDGKKSGEAEFTFKKSDNDLLSIAIKKRL